VGTELQHVTAQLALEVAEATAPYVGTQLKLRDDLFWFGKPRVLWWLIQFISFQVMRLADMNNVLCRIFYMDACFLILTLVLAFQNAFEMATFLWSLVSFFLICLIGYIVWHYHKQI
jgi:hypothetical protein